MMSVGGKHGVCRHPDKARQKTRKGEADGPELVGANKTIMEQEKYYVCRTNAYGRRPHANYTVTLASGDTALTETPTLEALLAAIPSDGYIVKEDIIPVMDALAKTGGIEQTDEERLAFAKEMLIREITAHDTSSSVNGFKLNGLTVWLDKDTRMGLMNSTTISKNMGQATTTVWFGGISLTIPCDTAIQMLSALEMYALECFNVTAEHKAAVKALTSIDDVVGYDYCKNYPEQLSLSV